MAGVQLLRDFLSRLTNREATAMLAACEYVQSAYHCPKLKANMLNHNVDMLILC